MSDIMDRRATKTAGHEDKIYTEDFVRQELKGMAQRLSMDPEIVVMGELFDDKVYSPQRMSEWRDEYGHIKDILELLNKIKSILETRLVSKSLHNKLNPIMTIFTLKNNYNWKDRQEIETTGNAPVTITIKQGPGRKEIATDAEVIEVPPEIEDKSDKEKTENDK